MHKVPAVTADGVHYTGDGSGEGWVVNAKSPAKDITLEFVKYMFSPEVYDEHIAGLGGFPAMQSALDQVKDPKVQEMVKWMDTDGADHILFGAGSWDAVSNVCQSILDGSIEPAAGAKQIQADVMADPRQGLQLGRPRPAPRWAGASPRLEANEAVVPRAPGQPRISAGDHSMTHADHPDESLADSCAELASVRLPRAGRADAAGLHGGADGQFHHAELPVLERHVGPGLGRLQELPR